MISKLFGIVLLIIVFLIVVIAGRPKSYNEINSWGAGSTSDTYDGYFPDEEYVVYYYHDSEWSLEYYDQHSGDKFEALKWARIKQEKNRPTGLKQEDREPIKVEVC